ncbi:MAG TPA: hypothetical protein VHO92_05000 [Methanobacterium sp.]|nr:hypothetical protein [Methanobacterium sp.]
MNEQRDKNYLTSLLNACKPDILFTKLVKVDNQISKDYKGK